MIPSEDMLRAWRLRVTMAIIVVVVGTILLILSLVHLAFTNDVIPLLFVAACFAAGVGGTRRLLDPRRLGR